MRRSVYPGVMNVALLTVGDEVLSGDTVNTNANWLATQLSERGATVARILSLPDDRETIAEHVSDYSEQFDAVIVTGGIGGTPDDVTMDAVADAFDREMTVPELTLADVNERLADIEEQIPDIDLDVDPESEAAVPEESRPLLNEAGLAPGCVLANVYVFPGIPDELEAMFEQVAGEFTGDKRTRTLYTVEPEANIVPRLEAVMAEFDVTVGCYPDRDAGHNRLKITATDDEQLDGATEWLLDNVDASETPVSRDWGEQ
jgi:nicotinamide-nucleotide amidase